MPDFSAIRKIGQAAVRAAEASFDGKQYAVVVIVRELPFPGMPIDVATNINTGKEHILMVLDEAQRMILSQTGIIIPS